MKLLRFALAFILCIGAALSLSACMKEEDYYTKADVDALIAELNSALTEKEEACGAKIKSLRDEYEAKIAELEAEDAENAEAIAALTATYEAKIAELEAEDAENAEAIASLTATYEAKIAELEAEDEANAEAIAALTATYEAKIAELEAEDAENAEAIAALTATYEAKIAELEAEDAENAEAIAALTATYEAKIAELESEDAENSEAIAALTATYEAKIAELEAEDAENAEAIAALTATYEAKVAEIEADYNEKLSSVNALIEALEEAELDNVRRIALLEAQMQALLSKHEHTYGEWIGFSGNDTSYCEDRFFYRVCDECNVMELKKGAYENHSFKTVTTPPTCAAVGFDTLTCTICGKVEIKNETAVVPHDYNTEYFSDNTYHWYNCKNCDQTIGKAEHSFGASGYCTVCNMLQGLTYQLSADGTYAEVVGYTGTAKEIAIASEFNGVPVRTIYSRAFKNSTIISVIIPDSITSFGSEAFYSCPNLETINYRGTKEEWAAIEKGSDWIGSGYTIVYNYTDPTPGDNGSGGSGSDRPGISLPFLPADD